MLLDLGVRTLFSEIRWPIQFLFYSLKIPFHCEGNAALFPFDEMSCTAKFESRKYPFHSFNLLLCRILMNFSLKRALGNKSEFTRFFSCLHPRGGWIPVVVAPEARTRKPKESVASRSRRSINIQSTRKRKSKGGNTRCNLYH